MNPEDIQQRCIDLIAQVKQISAATITPATTFEELAIDSLDKVSIAFDIEELYKIDIPEHRLATIHSVADMVSGIEQALEAQALAAQALAAKTPASAPPA